MTTDPKKPAPRRGGTWSTQPSWPTVAVVVATLAAMVAFYALAKGEDRTESILLLGAIGTAIAGLMRPILSRRYEPLVLLLAVSLGLPALAGCGASALRTHATIGAVAQVTMSSTRELVPAGCDAALTACHGDAECIDRTAGDCRTAATAYDSALAGVRAYLDAVQVAAMGDEGLVLPALLVGLQSLAHLWESTRAALAGVGVSLPALPPIALELLAGVGGAS